MRHDTRIGFVCLPIYEAFGAEGARLGWAWRPARNRHAIASDLTGLVVVRREQRVAAVGACNRGRIHIGSAIGDRSLVSTAAGKRETQSQYRAADQDSPIAHRYNRSAVRCSATKRMREVPVHCTGAGEQAGYCRSTAEHELSHSISATYIVDDPPLPSTPIGQEIVHSSAGAKPPS